MANDVDATVVVEPKTKQPKRKQSKKNESTIDETVDPSPATTTIIDNEDDPRPALDQKMLASISKRKEVAIKRRQDLLKAREESSSKAVAFIPPRPTTVVENEDDDDIQIIKVVKDPNVDPALSQCEVRRDKRHLTKRVEEQNKKKKP
ncbi:hypothetical protein Leryth_021922 [Lithospermum erythrorhizon]|nr:hypothetical protein Leryth_021922 [Lithospermum erythrorhizon]